MPLTVNHEQRRQRIAEITADLIATQGLDAVTIRHVAQIAGYSTTIVTHYFSGKLELLMYAFRFATDQHRIRITGVISKDECDLAGCVASMLPIGKTGLRSWKLYFAFWHVASVQPGFARELRNGIKLSRTLLKTVLDNLLRSERIAADTNTSDLARRLLTIIQGIAVQAIVSPSEWTSRTQREFIESELALLIEGGVASPRT